MSPWLRHLVVAVVLGVAGVILSMGAIGIAGAQGGPKPFDTRIVNTESEPVPVSLAAGSSEPFQEDQIADAPFAFHVPADKKAIIKFVTGVCRYDPDHVRNGVILRVNGGSVNLAGNTPLKIENGPNVGSYLVNFTQQVLLTALPGSSVFIDIPPASVCVAFLSGDLIPAD